VNLYGRVQAGTGTGTERRQGVTIRVQRPAIPFPTLTSTKGLEQRVLKIQIYFKAYTPFRDGSMFSHPKMKLAKPLLSIFRPRIISWCC